MKLKTKLIMNLIKEKLRKVKIIKNRKMALRNLRKNFQKKSYNQKKARKKLNLVTRARAKNVLFNKNKNQKKSKKLMNLTENWHQKLKK